MFERLLIEYPTHFMENFITQRPERSKNLLAMFYKFKFKISKTNRFDRGSVDRISLDRIS
jgi:hypothetical protein